MIIDYNNRNLIETFDVQDSVFEGFFYDYKLDAVNFSCMNYFLHKQFCFCFQGVVMVNMQSCDFWGRGHWIYYIRHNEDSPLLTQLQHLKSNQRHLEMSKLDVEKAFLCVLLTLNSGDELEIVCERIEILETPEEIHGTH